MNPRNDWVLVRDITVSHQVEDGLTLNTRPELAVKEMEVVEPGNSELEKGKHVLVNFIALVSWVLPDGSTVYLIEDKRVLASF